MVHAPELKLPGLNCGLCGYRTCDEFHGQLASSPELIRRCIHLSENRVKQDSPEAAPVRRPEAMAARSRTGGATAGVLPVLQNRQERSPWRDSLDREFDFYLEHFPEEPGPREIILPHNPLITREMERRARRHSHRPAAGDVVRLPDHPLRRGDGGGSSHGGDRLVRDRPAGPAPKGFQGPGLLHRRGLRGPRTPAPAAS